jgi:hypothetical protein
MAMVNEARKQQWEEKVHQAQGYADKIMLGAAIVGFLACFMPALSIQLFGTSVSAKVVDDWRGKLDFAGYIAVGVMAFMMLKNAAIAPSKGKVLACLIVSAVVALLAIWLPLSLGDVGEGASKGFGLWLNILAALAMLVGSALKAKATKMI